MERRNDSPARYMTEQFAPLSRSRVGPESLVHLRSTSEKQEGRIRSHERTRPSPSSFAYTVPLPHVTLGRGLPRDQEKGSTWSGVRKDAKPRAPSHNFDGNRRNFAQNPCAFILQKSPVTVKQENGPRHFFRPSGSEGQNRTRWAFRHHPLYPGVTSLPRMRRSSVSTSRKSSSRK